MTKLLISSLIEDQDVVSMFMVRGRQLRSYRDRPGSFLILRLGDKSGTIEAKLWDDALQWYEQAKVETILKVAGRTQLYNGRLEMNVTRMRIARDDEYSLEDFLPSSARDSGQMLAEMARAIDNIGNAYLRELLGRIFTPEMLREFACAPAAKVIHHAFLGGLLEHSLEVLRFCYTAQELYPGVDRDLLAAGALLHDIGKIQEYVYRRSIDFSDEGRLVGHIVLGEELVVERAKQIDGFPHDLLLRLRHMLLSHHGKFEWQSPKRPKTMEACVLHLADYFSGQVAIFDATIKANNDSNASWTEYNRYLDRAIFIGSVDNVLQPAGDDADALHHIMEERYHGY